MAKDEFIEEIKEDVRRDQMLKIWDEFGNIIIGVGLALIIAVAGYIGYEKFEKSNIDDQSARFEQLLNRPDDEAVKAEILKDGTDGFKLLAILNEAISDATGELERTQLLGDLAEKKGIPSFYKDYARFSALAAKFNATNPGEMAKELRGFMESKSAFKSMARELLAFANLKLGETEGARNLFLENASDNTAPRGVRSRASAMIQFLG